MKVSKIFRIVLGILVLSVSSCKSDVDYSGSPNVYFPPTNDFATGSGDNYNTFEENPFILVSDQAISTFSVDADGASYANVRRYIMQDNQIPPTDAVRTEELINYFDLDYGYENPDSPIALNGEISLCPWNASNKLIRIGIQGKPIEKQDLEASNFVFLIDVSGSMASEDKLELLKNGFNLFVDKMEEKDKVAIVTYAGASSVPLESTSGLYKQKIKSAINALGSGGSTAGAMGIISAYEIAQRNFIENGNNRIIMGTDGDFNVGVSTQEELVELIEEKRDLGIFLTVLGVGRGNLNDASLEQIANNGNGNYEYIDNIEQLKKVFIYESNKFYTVAKDVKVQVEFNANNVEAYRLIGYENRLLDTEDFEDDTKDAGEIGVDQNITALYEIVPRNNNSYRAVPTFTVDFRYKEPNSEISIPIQLEIFDEGKTFEQSTDYMRFTASVASFSMLIRNSKYKGDSNFDTILNWLSTSKLNDKYGFKEEFKQMVTRGKEMSE